MSWFIEYKRSLKMVEVEEFFDLFFYRPLAFILVKTIYSTNITPNQLTITSICFGLAAASVYAIGSRVACSYGALLFMMYNIIDCSDGQLARLKKNGTPAGRIIDGMADYISTIAVFLGLGIGYPDHRYQYGYWWWLLIAAGASNLFQSVVVDYHRNQFLDYVLQKTNTFGEDFYAFKEEYNRIKDQPNKWFDKWIIKAYFKYSALQRKLTAKKEGVKLFIASPQEYYEKNKIAIRIWVLIGPTAQVTTLMICSFFNRFDIFFWLIIGLFNAIGVIMLIVQRNIDKTFKTN